MAPSTLSWLDRVQVAAVIRSVCAERSLKLVDLARLAEVNYSQLKAIARGRAEVDEATRQRLEGALGARFDDFVVEFEPECRSRSVDVARVRRRDLASPRS